eukprot:2649739-Rhodomonas_salina.2
MFGTELAYGTTRPASTSRASITPSPLVPSPISLRPCYAMSCTDPAYWYPVRLPYAMSGTDLAHWCLRVMPGTDLGTLREDTLAAVVSAPKVPSTNLWSHALATPCPAMPLRSCNAMCGTELGCVATL